MVNSVGSAGPIDSIDDSRSRGSIILISTKTIDRVTTPDGIVEAPGGPPRFVVPALAKLGWHCRVVTGAVAQVEVVGGAGGEEYVVPSLPMIRLPACLRADAIILSPIMREIDIHHLPSLEGLVVADLQGFVRRPGVRSGTPNREVDLTPLLPRVDVVKATAGELDALSRPSRAMLDDRILVVTRGQDGALVIQRDSITAIASRPVHDVPTIGAGDTFLANFAASLLDGATPATAAQKAARLTETFLEARRSG